MESHQPQTGGQRCVPKETWKINRSSPDEKGVAGRSRLGKGASRRNGQEISSHLPETEIGNKTRTRGRGGRTWRTYIKAVAEGPGLWDLDLWRGCH